MRNLTDKLGLRFPQSFLEELGDAPEQDRIPKLQEYLSNLKQFAGYIKDMTGTVGKTSAEPAQQQPAEADQTQKVRKKALERLKFEGFVFAFDNIGAVISFCGHLTGQVKVQSRLYKDVEKNRFFLHFQRGRESMLYSNWLNYYVYQNTPYMWGQILDEGNRRKASHVLTERTSDIDMTGK